MLEPTDPPDTTAMVYVPSGEFHMGCDDNNSSEIECFPEEIPLHDVYLDSYYIDMYEVTNAEYRRCVAAGACKPPRENNSLTRRDYYTSPQYDSYPVVYVSWWDAVAYCGWENKRLPTEAEWEKAAAWPSGYARLAMGR